MVNIRIAILWDFDGVIVFTPHEEAWRLVALKYGITNFSSEFYHKYVSGKPRYEGARAVLEHFGLLRDLRDEEIQKIIHDFAEEKNTLFNDLISRGYFAVNKEAIEFVNRTKLDHENIFINILASASRNVSKLASNVYYGNKLIRDYFDYDVSGSGDTKKKVFENGIRIAKDVNCVAVIDDAPSGIRAALELKALAIGYRNTDLYEYGAIKVIKSFNEISPKELAELCMSR